MDSSDYYIICETKYSYNVAASLSCQCIPNQPREQFCENVNLPPLISMHSGLGSLYPPLVLRPVSIYKMSEMQQNRSNGIEYVHCWFAELCYHY